MYLYLRAKHWQIFVVLIGALFIAQATAVNAIVAGGELNIVSIALPTLLAFLLYFGWLIAISSACFDALPAALASSPKKVKWSFGYVVGYFLYVVFALATHPQSISVFIIFPHLLAMFAVCYSLAFTAKQLAKLDNGRAVTFIDYAGMFFLFWFFPVGVWFLQPKVNRLLGDGYH